ncbi:TPA: hypothetical protein ACKRN8_006087, partial [Pseudomonas aeruginosa]
KNRIVIAKDEKNVLTCTSEGFEYTPDIVKNVYGKSSRNDKPLIFLVNFRGFFFAQFLACSSSAGPFLLPARLAAPSPTVTGTRRASPARPFGCGRVE